MTVLVITTTLPHISQCLRNLWHWDKLFSGYFRFPISVTLCQYSLPIFCLSAMTLCNITIDRVVKWNTSLFFSYNHNLCYRCVYIKRAWTFDVFSTVLHSIELFHQPILMHNFLYSLTICFLHYYPRHVSSINMPIFRRKNCIHTASGIFALCKRLPSTLVESGCVNTIFPPEDGHINAWNMSRIIM